MFIPKEKKSLSLRLTDETRKQLNRLANMFDYNPEDYSDRDLIEKICGVAEKNQRPTEEIKAHNAALSKAAIDEKTKNEQLQNEIKALKKINEVSAVINEDAEKLAIEHEQIKKDLEIANQQLEASQQQLEASNQQLATSNQQLATSRLTDNQVVVTLNDFFQEIINAYLDNEEIKISFEKSNQNGKYNGILDKINTPNRKTNIANLLTTTFIASVKGKVLKPIFSSKIIKNAIQEKINK